MEPGSRRGDGNLSRTAAGESRDPVNGWARACDAEQVVPAAGPNVPRCRESVEAGGIRPDVTGTSWRLDAVGPGVRRDDPIFSRTAVGAGRGLHPGLARQRWHLSGVAHLAPQRRCSVRELSRFAVPEATSPMPTGNASTGGNYSGQQWANAGTHLPRARRTIDGPRLSSG